MAIELFKKAGDCTYAKGPNFEYKRVGSVSSFTFTGKLHSRRVIRELVKRLETL